MSVLLSAGGVSLFSQAIALARQVLLVSVFGFSRELDIYSTLYGILSVCLFSVAAIVDNIYVSLLSGVRDERGPLAFGAAIRAFVAASLLFSVAWVLLVALLFPVLSLPFSAGFDDVAKDALRSLALSSLPWALLIIPYTAMGACLKCGWRYTHFFIAELIVTLTSTLAIYLRHQNIEDVALAFGIGYGIGAFFLGISLRRLTFSNIREVFPWGEFLRRLSRHFASNQVGTLTTLVDRFWFSYLPAGGIAALTLVQQLTMNLGGLLGLRDTYLVPLAEKNGRAGRLSRLLLGLFIAAVAAAIFVAVFAKPICSVLFLYGKVAASDVSMVASLLMVGVLAMMLSVVATPVWRLQQMSAEYRPLAMVYLVTAASTSVLGWGAIKLLELGAMGMALIAAFNAAWACLIALAYAKRYGAHLVSADRRLALVSLLVFVVSGVFAGQASAAMLWNPVGRLAAGAVIYSIGVGLYVYVSRKHLLPIVRGRSGGGA